MVDKVASKIKLPLPGESPPSEVHDYSDKTHKELLEIYKSLVLQGQAFKPGGTARILFNNLRGVIDSLRVFADEAGYHQRQYKDVLAQMQKLQEKYQEVCQKYDDLVVRSYPLDKFNLFSKKLYKAIGIDGPPIVSPPDISKFHDAVYAKFQEHTPEPDLP